MEPNEDGSKWTPTKGSDATVGHISRDEINGLADAKVAIFPSRPDGIRFLKENNAWGFVRMNQEPDYAGFYVSGEEKEIRYFSTVQKIIPAEEATLARDYNSVPGKNKKVIVFEPGTLYELVDPIPYKNKAPQSRIYTNLSKFKLAETTDDLY